MSRNTLIGIIVFILVVEMGIWAYFGVALSKKGITKKTNTPQTVKTTGLLQTNLANPAIKSAVVTYVFEGTVLEVKNGSPAAELLTSVKGVGIPKFILTKETKIFFSDKKGETKAAIADLKPKQEVNINSLFNLKKKTWTTDKVKILIEKTK